MVDNRSLGLVLCSLLSFIDRLENLLVGRVFINPGRKSDIANWDSPEGEFGHNTCSVRKPNDIYVFKSYRS